MWFHQFNQHLNSEKKLGRTLRKCPLAVSAQITCWNLTLPFYRISLFAINKKMFVTKIIGFSSEKLTILITAYYKPPELRDV